MTWPPDTFQEVLVVLMAINLLAGFVVGVVTEMRKK